MTLGLAIKTLVLIAAFELVLGGLRFASHFSSNMVLQRAPQKALVWGYRDANDIVKVKIQKQLKESAALLIEAGS